MPGVGTVIKSPDVPSPEEVNIWDFYYGQAVLI